MGSWVDVLEGAPADCVAVMRDGDGAAIASGSTVRWARSDGAILDLSRQTGKGPEGLAFDPDGRLWCWSGGEFRGFDAAGRRHAKFRSKTGLVRRGALAGGDLVLEGYRRVSARGGVRWAANPVGFMAADRDAVVDPTGTWLEIVGSAGMDSGWSARYQVADGALLEEGMSGYAIDAIEFDGEGTIAMDDYLGLYGHQGVHGSLLWKAGESLFVQQREGVLRFLDGEQRRWALTWPRELCASDDGQIIAVVSDGTAHFAGPDDPRWQPVSG